MCSKPTSKPDDPAQSQRFVEAARKAEADETEEGAERAFNKVIHQKSEALKGYKKPQNPPSVLDDGE